MTDEEINTEILLDHYRNPHNHGQIDDASEKLIEFNPVCGDTVQLTIKIDNDVVSDIKFIGRGCSVSQGSASMLTDKVKGMKIEEIKKINEDDILRMLGLKLGPSREKCALLSLNALQKCIANHEKKAQGGN